MIIDFSIRNFRSFQAEQLFSMNVEGNRQNLSGNHSEIEGGKYSVLRSAAIFGPNASGKSNLLKSMQALKWLIASSRSLNEEDSIPVYEPFKLSADAEGEPVEFEIEFVVPSRKRYRYAVAFTRDRIVSESLHAFPKRQSALMFSLSDGDTWETVKFGATYKGGDRRLPFFSNSTYISRAGNDASAPQSIREIVQYFRSIVFVDAGVGLHVSNYYDVDGHLEVVSDLICLADTGVRKITTEKRPTDDIKLPDDMPEAMKRAIIEKNSISYKFWHESQDGSLIKFDTEDMSDGTVKLFEILPLLLTALSSGAPIFVDELDGHLHTNIVSLVFELFNDPIANCKKSQLIVTTHDTNLMDSGKLRRDQIWLTNKTDGATTLTSLDEYNKATVRANSPFEDFYKDGRFGALPSLSYVKIRDAVAKISSIQGYINSGDGDA